MFTPIQRLISDIFRPLLIFRVNTNQGQIFYNYTIHDIKPKKTVVKVKNYPDLLRVYLVNPLTKEITAFDSARKVKNPETAISTLDNRFFLSFHMKEIEYIIN